MDNNKFNKKRNSIKKIATKNIQIASNQTLLAIERNFLRFFRLKIMFFGGNLKKYIKMFAFV